MEKLAAESYRGIEFIRLATLPKQQYELFSSWLDGESIISILIGTEMHRNCVQYSEYDHWFENVYKKNQSSETVVKKKSSGVGRVDFAISGK